MSVDLKAIENSVMVELSGKIRARVKGDQLAVDLHIAIAQLAAEVVTTYLEEYIKATDQQ